MQAKEWCAINESWLSAPFSKPGHQIDTTSRSLNDWQCSILSFIMKRPPSNLELHSLCSNGNLEELRTFLEKTVHSLSQDEQITLCSHAGKPCQNVPCTNKVTSLAETAAKANQPAIFAYLWDSILGPRDCRISWTSLRAAARLGSIFLAQTFHARDLECFNIVEPPSPHGSRGGGTQIEVGMRHDNFDYVNFIQVHGADMNNNFPNRSPIRAAVLSAIGDGEHNAKDWPRFIFPPP